MRLILPAVFALAATAVHADAQSDAEYIASVTATRANFEGALMAQRPMLVSAIQHDMSTKGIVLPEPERFFDMFVEVWIDSFTAEMQSVTAEIYLDLFSETELEALAAFYATDAGQAMLEKTPELMMRGAQAGAEVGMIAGLRAGPMMADRIRDENLIEFQSDDLLRALEQ